MSDLTGQRLGQYLILERISKGATSTVYKAHQEKLDRYVAVKVLAPHFIDEEGFLERFKQEARAVAQLDHPNILPVYDFDQVGDIVYIVMKYVDTGTLKEMTGAPLDLRLTLEIITQVGLALGYAHRQGVVHRDVKPGNILIGEGNWALLTDFGLAKIRAGDRKLTKSGIGMGTPDYMSPEQAQGLPVDGRSDLYSLGCTLHEMVTGRVPFEADSGMAVVVKHITEPPRPPREFNPKLPLAVEQVTLRALEKNPNRRYQTAEAMVADLARAVGRTDQFVLPEALTPAPASRLPAARLVESKPIAVITPATRTAWRRRGQTATQYARRAGRWLWAQLKRIGRAIRAGLMRLAHWLKRAALAIAAFLGRQFQRLREVVARRRSSAALAAAPRQAAADRKRTATTRVLKPPAGKAAPKTSAAQPTVAMAAARVQKAAEAIRARARNRRWIIGVAAALLLLLLTLLGFRLGAQAQGKATPSLVATAGASTIDVGRTPNPPGVTAAPLPEAPKDMLGVAGGAFKMGATGGKFDADETPPHQVTVDAFYIDVVEVTNAQFTSFVNDTGYVTDAEKKGDATTWRSGAGPGRERFPVTRVSWNDAVAYCGWRGKRLPTEAEWEFAAKGFTDNVYAWGNGFSSDLTNTAERRIGAPIEVASLGGVSPFGAYDMIGNVWEWVSDWYGGDYYAVSPATNPPGPAGGLARVIRGGSFKSDGERATTTIRRKASQDGWSDDIGLRCATSVNSDQ